MGVSGGRSCVGVSSRRGLVRGMARIGGNSVGVSSRRGLVRGMARIAAILQGGM